MEQLSENIRQVAEQLNIEDIEKHLRETAKKWACYVLENDLDESLKLGLEISRSICNYLNKISENDESLK